MPKDLAKPASPMIKEPSPSSGSGQYPGKPVSLNIKGDGMKTSKPTPKAKRR